MSDQIKSGEPEDGRKPDYTIESDEPLPSIRRWSKDYIAPTGAAAWALMSLLAFIVVCLLLFAMILSGNVGSAIIFLVLFSVVVLFIKIGQEL